MKTNIREFKKLIKLYESLTLEDCASCDPEKITGFGTMDKCTICKAKSREMEYYENNITVEYPQCKSCIWGRLTYAILKNSPYFEKTHAYSYLYNVSCTNHVTYRLIGAAKTPEELLTAYQNRAKFMRKTLTKLGYKQP